MFIFFFIQPSTTSINTLPYTTLFRSSHSDESQMYQPCPFRQGPMIALTWPQVLAFRLTRHHLAKRAPRSRLTQVVRSEEHTSELQSPYDLVCRLLLEKKKTTYKYRAA